MEKRRPNQPKVNTWTHKYHYNFIYNLHLIPNSSESWQNLHFKVSIFLHYHVTWTSDLSLCVFSCPIYSHVPVGKLSLLDESLPYTFCVCSLICYLILFCFVLLCLFFFLSLSLAFEVVWILTAGPCSRATVHTCVSWSLLELLWRWHWNCALMDSNDFKEEKWGDVDRMSFFNTPLPKHAGRAAREWHHLMSLDLVCEHRTDIWPLS